MEVGLSLLGEIDSDCTLLDYGCGLGYFIDAVRERLQIEAVGYDKFMDSDHPSIYSDLDRVDGASKYDFFTCFETLEHCHRQEQERIMRLAARVLKPEGRVILSVPIEVGPISIVKNALRLKTKDATFPDFTLWNVLKTACYRPTTWHRDTLEYPGHFGFDHRPLERWLRSLSFFRMVYRRFSPLTFVPSSAINSQVFYILEKT